MSLPRPRPHVPAIRQTTLSRSALLRLARLGRCPGAPVTGQRTVARLNLAEQGAAGLSAAWCWAKIYLPSIVAFQANRLSVKSFSLLQPEQR